MKTVEVYTDGGCFPNPGNGGWAFVLSEDEYKSGSRKNTTNNQMELQAVIEAIGYCKHEFPGHFIKVYSDSMYCVQGFNSWMHNWQRKGWKKKGGLKNVDQWQILWDIKDLVVLEWVKAHNGNPLNEIADDLANAAVYQI